MKLFIEKIGEKPIVTKKGPATKVGVFSNNTWYSCFKGPWNEGWQKGMTIDVEVRQTEDGKYWNILPPKRQYQNDDFSEVKSMMTQIMKELLEIKGMLAFPAKTVSEEPPPHKDEDMPPDQEEIDANQLPF